MSAGFEPRPVEAGGMSSKSWFARWFGGKPKQAPQRPGIGKGGGKGGANNPYHAVSVVPGTDACPAAYRFSGQRYLSRQAPRLPLPSCDVQNCSCRFKHHKDRRSGPRRHSDWGMVMAGYSGQERRRSRGRRSTDEY